MTEPYTARHSHTLARQANISYRQLDEWVRRGFSRPIRSTQRGKGYQRVWNEDERLIVIEMGRLVNAGIRPPEAARIARQHVTEPSIDGKYLIAVGVSIIFED